MSRFFYKGKIEKKPKHESFGFNTKRAAKNGTEMNPINLSVQDDERQQVIQAQLDEHGLFGHIEINPAADENIAELEALLKTPATIVLDKTPNRNDPCSCGSGKKYKKCCG